MSSIDEDDLREKLGLFYEKHNPAAAANIDQILGMVKQTGISEHELFTKLTTKYKVPYDPLDWKRPVIGKGTINGATVERHGSGTLQGDKLGVGSAGGVHSDARDKPRTGQVGLPSTTTSNSTTSARAATTATAPAPSPAGEPRDPSVVYSEEEAERYTNRRKKLVMFYERYNPIKLTDVDKIMQLGMDSTDEDIFEALCKKYHLPVRDVFKKLEIDSEKLRTGASAGGNRDLRGQLQEAESQEKGEEVLRAEFAEWISSTLNITPALTAGNVFEHLRDGVLLCQLLDALDRDCKCRYQRNPPNHFQKLANVDAFLQAAQSNFGITDEQLFDPQALVDGASPSEERAIMTLFLCVAKVAHTKFRSNVPQIVKLELEVEKEDLDLEMTNADLERVMLRKQQQEEEEERLRRAEAARLAEELRLRQEKELAEAQRRKRKEEEARLRREMERRRLEEEQRRKEEEAMRRERERARKKLSAMTPPPAQPAEDEPIFQYKNKKYVADRRDAVDQKVAEVLNSLPNLTVSTQMYKLKGGMYVIEYPKRIVFFVRVCRNTCMIRVGGGWQSLEEFLLQRLKMYPEITPKFSPLHDGGHAGERVVLLHQTHQHSYY